MSARVLLAAPVLVVALAACGSGGGAHAAAVSSTSPSALLAAAPCADSPSPDPQVELMVREQATCSDASDNSLTAYTFSTAQAESQWVQIGQQFGTTPVVVGDRWVVAVNTQAQAQAVQRKLGGKVQ